jgi:hypothetical protein
MRDWKDVEWGLHCFVDAVEPLPFRHKLNYFSFCQTFEYLFIIFAKILINLNFHLFCLLFYIVITYQKFQN